MKTLHDELQLSEAWAKRNVAHALLDLNPDQRDNVMKAVDYLLKADLETPGLLQMFVDGIDAKNLFKEER